MTTSFHQQSTEQPHTPYEIACAAVTAMGDQWGVRPGPWGRTGHLRNADHTPFTVGVCEAGYLYLRNDELGDSVHLPLSSTADLPTLGQAIANVIGELF
ncbi:hypothetical protein [Streptomyces sp. Tue6028]|uniref:hypothetical protein n=1 Tax=Streptomyces sp. Tue6028 TaxID=2036037 RepID=UPI003EB96DEA